METNNRIRARKKSRQVSPKPDHCYLEQLTGKNALCIPLIRGSSCKFGREVTNTIILSNTLVSRYHAVIDSHESTGYVLTDLGSRNGTLLNGSPIRRPTRLAGGDEIEIGPFFFTFHDCSSAEGSFPQSSADPTLVDISLEVITVLVMDIRGFTGWARQVQANDVASFMAALFAEADVILSRNGAWAHKYIGDAVMAIWRHLRNGDMDVLRAALTSTEELFRALERVNSRLQSPTPLRMGAGLNTGLASLGNFGSDRSMDYTALGDPVNKAFRLEAATRALDCDIVLGNATYSLLDSGMCRKFIEKPVALKGYGDLESAWSISVEGLCWIIDHGFPPTPESDAAPSAPVEPQEATFADIKSQV